jgi:hypothetical protein
MKKIAIAILAFALITIGATREAKAQDGFGTILAVVAVGVAVDAAVGAGGVVTGIGSSVYAAQGSVSKGWFISSYIFGGLNAVSTVIWGVVASNNTPNDGGLSLGFTLAHASVTALDFIAPTVGFVNGNDGPKVSAVPVGGTDAGGRIWAGAGLQLSHF